MRYGGSTVHVSVPNKWWVGVQNLESGNGLQFFVCPLCASKLGISEIELRLINNWHFLHL